MTRILIFVELFPLFCLASFAAFVGLPDAGEVPMILAVAYAVLVVPS